jgi:hypothetical protein
LYYKVTPELLKSYNIYTVWVSNMEENLRLNITLSRYDLERLKIWAGLHGKTPSAYASQIISARIEGNFELINAQLSDYANNVNKSIAEAKEELIN